MEPKPTNLSEVDFFTRQIMYPNGFAFFWVFKPMCPACNKARLTKLKKRDKVYTCTNKECGKVFSRKEYDALLNFNLEYVCPKCNKKGELFGHWVKPAKGSAKVIQKFVCEHCNAKLKIVRMRKQKTPKKK